VNAIIGAFAGGLLAVGGIVGGVSAYETTPTAVPQDQLYSYADQ
jgi:hypothetical protein